jgi:hypothetical protein
MDTISLNLIVSSFRDLLIIMKTLLNIGECILLGIVLSIPTFLVMYIVSNITVAPKEPPQKFEEVDTYKGCVVVRYTPVNSAHYHYFLDCTGDT